MAKLDKRGHEIIDETPVEIPLKFRRIDNLTEQIRSVIAQEFSRAAFNEGKETFEEADDFEIGDDYEPVSEYELDANQEAYNYVRDERGGERGAQADRGGAPPAEGPIQRDGEENPSSGTSEKRGVPRNRGANKRGKDQKGVTQSPLPSGEEGEE